MQDFGALGFGALPNSLRLIILNEATGLLRPGERQRAGSCKPSGLLKS